jgi:hypothetical protein
MTEGKRNLIQGLPQEYDIQSAKDIQDAPFLQLLHFPMHTPAHCYLNTVNMSLYFADNFFEHGNPIHFYRYIIGIL